MKYFLDKEESDRRWLDFLHSEIDKWTHIKARFQIGDHVTGTPKMYFPQGIIVEVENSVYGIIPQKRLPLNEKLAFHIGQPHINFEITSYEEHFHWLALKSL